MKSGEIVFQRIRRGDLAGRCRVDSPVELFEPVALFNKDRATVCKTGSRITCAIAANVFVKCYFYRNFFSRLRHLFRVSRAGSSTGCALAIRQAGVPTPAPWGYLRERGMILPVRDYLFTDVLPRETNFMHELFKKSPGEAAEKLVRCLEKLHANGIEHGDLSLRNLYISPSGEVGVIDLDGCRLHKAPLCRRIRIRELARVISSAAKTDGTLSLEECSRMFLELYNKICGQDLACHELTSRVSYLYNRRRRA